MAAVGAAARPPPAAARSSASTAAAPPTPMVRLLSPLAAMRSSPFQPARLGVAPSRARLRRRRRSSSAGRCAAAAGGDRSFEAPWSFLAQTNERLLQWDDVSARALVRLQLRYKLDLGEEEVEARLEALAALLPDLAVRLEVTRADILAELLADLPALAARLLALRELLPRSDVSALAARLPALLTKAEFAPPAIAARLALIRAQLGGGVREAAVESMVSHEPLLLRAAVSVPDGLATAARLLGPRADAVAAFMADPAAFLDMAALGQASSVEVDGVQLQ
jgi:hypothetical protein